MKTNLAVTRYFTDDETTLVVNKYFTDDEITIELNKIYQLNHSGISDVYIYRDFPNSDDSIDIAKWLNNSRCLNDVIDKYGDSTQIQLENIEQEDKSINTNIIVNGTTPFQPFNSLSAETNVFKIIISCYSQGGSLKITIID